MRRSRPPERSSAGQLARIVEQRELVDIWALDPILPECEKRRVDVRPVGQGAVAFRHSGHQHLDRRVEKSKLHGDAVLARPGSALVALTALPYAALVNHRQPFQDEHLASCH